VPISRSRLRWGFVALLAAAIAAAVFVTEPWPTPHDASLFIVIGRGMLSGRPPYTGLWDDKPVGIYLVGALAWILDQGNTVASMQALSVAAIAITATSCAWFVSSVTSRFWAGIVTVIAVAGGLSLPDLSYGGGMSELFAVTGISVCLAATGGIMLNRRGLIWPAVAGAGFAWAISCSLLTLGAVPAMAVLWLTIPVDGAAYPLGRATWRTWIRRRLFDRRLAMAVGVAAVVLLVLWLPVLAGAALPAALDAFLRYNSLYRAAAGSLKIRSWVDGVAYFWPVWLPTLAMALVPTARRQLLGFRVMRSNFARVVALWGLGEAALLVYGLRFYARYLMLVVPPLAVMLGLTLGTLWLERPEIGRRAVALAMCAAVVLGLGWQARPGPSYEADFAANARLVAYIQANSAASDSIYVWGDDPDLYVRSNRQPAGAYFYLLPLTMPGYGPGAVATMVAAWQAQPPRLIVTGSSTVPDSVDLFPLMQTPAMGDPTGYAMLAPMQAFIRSHYDLVATFSVGEVWRYRG
jgi:hypothetical protein